MTATTGNAAPPTTPGAPSQRARMLRGEIYDSRDPELLALASHARALLREHAAADPSARHALLRALLADAGEGVWIEPPFFCDYGAHISIGAGTFVNTGCIFLDSAEIRIGENVLIGPGVQLLTASHPERAADRIVPADQVARGHAPYRTFARPITIGANAWIGAGAILLPGISIGHNAVIGAGSVVTTDIPNNMLAVGNPGRILRRVES